MTTTRTIAAALLPALLAVAPLGAQSLEIGVAGMDSGHELLGRLGGPTVHLVTKSRGRLRWQLDAERVAGGQDRMGVPCVGLVRPGEDCSPTPMHDDATLTTFGVGPRVTLLRRTRLEIAGVVTARYGVVNAKSDAPARGTQLDAQSALLGGDVGVCATWQPFARMPVAATAAFSVGQLVAPPETVVDGYTPLQDPVPYARLRVGLTWR